MQCHEMRQIEAMFAPMKASDALPPGFDRFVFISDALNASGGFRPRVTRATDASGLAKPASVSGPCYLVPYPRESVEKFAARAEVAVYENHLHSACEKFVGYLARKPPQREGADGPLTEAFLQDADWRGNALDIFWASFMLEARARGTMLALMDMPQEIPATLAAQKERRALPYLTAIPPELLRGFAVDESGRFTWVAIAAIEELDGAPTQVIREWDATGWRVRHGERVLREGSHSFGRCPVLAFTEGTEFPCFGSFAQIADISRRLFNAQSELDEILRSQTFSLLTYQVPPEDISTFQSGKVAAAVGTHNMLVHTGEAPGFIAPPDGPAAVYMKRIEALESAIRRIGLVIEETTEQAAESGLALQIRFQSLNAALGQFALRMQDFERQVWDLFAAGVGSKNRVQVTWALDYSFADVKGELDKLTSMQLTSFPEEVLAEKRKQITAAEFANVEPELLEELLEAIDEAAKEPKPDPNTDPNTDPEGDPEGDPEDPLNP